MKTKNLLGIIAFVAIFTLGSCSKDNNSSDTSLTSADAVAANKMDKASNDISDVVEDVYFQQNPSSAGKNATTFVTLLPMCASVSAATTTPTSWERTVTFTNCTFNGNILNGQIIVSGALPLPTANTLATTGYTINYEFMNFTHNAILIEGNRSITRKFASSQLSADNHPIHIIDIDMTATFPNGEVYTRVGTRTRECVENFGDGILSNNVYKIYQSITNTRPNGAQHSHVVLETSPLKIDMACQYKVISGVLTITGTNNTAVIDYGNDTCDNNATIAINGGAATPFTFGN
ncbi:MAG: hypothetical protein ACOYLT_08665 [Flavobacterium sp.]|jgi:hypothetical protein|uniref:hypothetical protein n=1 Tax=Flavobacterium sp. TaxID=239 RepID=UPI003BEB7516